MRLFPFSLGLPVVAVCLLPASEFAMSGATGTSYDHALTALSVESPLSLRAGCIGCALCGSQPGGPHELVSTGRLMVFPGNEHFGQCVPDDCMEFHCFDYECGGEEWDDENLLLALATGQDMLAIADALGRFPNALKFHAPRGSLHLYNCQGDIAASIPLRPDLAIVLEALVKQ
ncbi:MAG: hypothetical protein ABR551_06745 [Gemmatimonadales bacterium]